MEGTQNVAGSRAGGSGRREEREREDRQQRLILLGAGAVLAAVALVVIVGLILTWYLPPRSHVLTVGGREFNAADVADRAIYLATIGNGNALRNPAEEGIDSLISQEILLRDGAEIVGDPTEEEVRAKVAERLSLEAEFTDQEYADALTSYLRVAPIDRQSLETVVRAGIIEDRLEEQFASELPESGDQMHLLAVPTTDRALAQSLIEAVRGGQDFAETAIELGIVESEEGVRDLGWFAPVSLGDRVGPAVQDLQGGEVSDVVDDARRVGFEVYYVPERTTDEPYREDVRDQLARRAFNEWKDEREAALTVELDLSDSESDWIFRRVQEQRSG